MKPKCCGLDAVWVENVPGKGYNYCRECKNEVTDSGMEIVGLSKIVGREQPTTDGTRPMWYDIMRLSDDDILDALRYSMVYGTGMVRLEYGDENDDCTCGSCVECLRNSVDGEE